MFLLLCFALHACSTHLAVSPSPTRTTDHAPLLDLCPLPCSQCSVHSAACLTLSTRLYDACRTELPSFTSARSLAVSALSAATDLSSLSHVVLTHLDPKAVPTLEAVLVAVAAARNSSGAASGSKLQLVLSNPALQLLQSIWGKLRGASGSELHWGSAQIAVWVRPGVSSGGLSGSELHWG